MVGSSSSKEDRCRICLALRVPTETEMILATLPAIAFKSPAAILSGLVDYDMYTKFRSEFDKASRPAMIGDCWPPIEILPVSGPVEPSPQPALAAPRHRGVAFSLTCDAELAPREPRTHRYDKPG